MLGFDSDSEKSFPSITPYLLPTTMGQSQSGEAPRQLSTGISELSDRANHPADF